MYIVSKDLLISSTTVIVCAGDPFGRTPLLQCYLMCSALTVECCVLYQCCVGVFGMFAVM